jgi:hypothetical protein
LLVQILELTGNDGFLQPNRSGMAYFSIDFSDAVFLGLAFLIEILKTFQYVFVAAVLTQCHVEHFEQGFGPEGFHLGFVVVITHCYRLRSLPNEEV